MRHSPVPAAQASKPAMVASHRLPPVAAPRLVEQQGHEQDLGLKTRG
ncbi:hypothetical protein RISK_002813 [Rhodopirellula islandica]|uniref:Uncharacterized protein n=1 Tax=Rhodopirellula islandica TaxID=595434 RepID=A0A0J1BEX2_RHOIS|nr:hypothetical protein RISK_002813 [Rhodopirellula islandica]